MLESKLRAITPADLDKPVSEFLGDSFSFDRESLRVGEEAIPLGLALALTSEARSRPAETPSVIKIEDL